MKIEMKDISDILVEAKKELEMSKEELLNKLWDTQDIVHKAIELNKQIKSFVYNEMVDRCVPGSTELYELVNEELKVLGGEKNR